ncbi:MAG: tetratricopeptide repeat-containing sensor histidine kinase, partial [Bacteroidales bacterium]|nr:tetratricopeptide repeat-containing sensor histidine kinase [Bacteroidales bacterium]
SIGSPDSTKTIFNDTIVHFEENFNDGDFTNNPVWESRIHQACAPEPPQIIVTGGLLKAHQTDGGICGTSATINTKLNIVVSDSTKIQFDIKPSYSNVDEGAGYFDWEFPMQVSMSLRNAHNEWMNLIFGYNYRGGNSRFKKNIISIAFSDCQQDVWLRNETFTIRDYFPDAMFIQSITVGGNGWDYEGYIDNIVIFDCFADTLLNKTETIEKYDKTTEKYNALSKDKKAIFLYNENLKIARKNNDHSNICNHLYTLGDLYYESGIYDTALIYFQQSYEKGKEINSKRIITKSLNSITEIYFRWNQFDKALEYQNFLLDYYKEQNDKTGIITTQNKIANIYSSLGNLQKANEFYIESLKLCEENNNTNLMAKTLENIGTNFQEAGQYEKALGYFQKSLIANEKSGNMNSVALLFFKIANVYAKVKKYEPAIENLNKSLHISRNKNLKSLESNIYLSYSEIYNTKGNNKTALGYYKLYNETKDFLKDKESNKEIAELYVKYETEKKEKEIEILKRDNEINQLEISQQRKIVQFFIIISGLVLILVFLIYSRYRINKKTNRILSSQKDKLAKALKEREIVQAELEKLNKNLEKRVKEEIQKFTDQEKIVVEQSRLADIGLLAAGIAHELNNPLQSMYLSLQNMNESLKEKNADKKYFETKIKYISEDIYRMKNIISHVRLFSRDYGSDIMEKFTINESIKNAISMFKVQYANHKIKLTIELGENINYIFGNKYKYERIVLNLLFNAKDALEEKENKMNERFQKTIQLRSFQKNDFAIMEFKDNGIGISQENRKKIFNAFYTTKEPGKGTGLGLSISKEIINDMGGEIEFESKLLEGTTMIVKVPVVSG